MKVARSSLRLTNLRPSDFRSNLYLEFLVFVKGRKPEKLEINPRKKRQ